MMKYVLASLAIGLPLPAIASQEDSSAALAALDSPTTASLTATTRAVPNDREPCRHADLERDFDGVRDDEWASAAEAALYGSIAQAPGLLLTDLVVQCHVMVCRLNFAFPTAAYQHDIGNTLVADAIDSTPGFLKDFGKIVPGVPGSPTIEYYLMRSGVCFTRRVK